MNFQKIQSNGSLPISLGWLGGFQKFEIVGGPYDAYPGRDYAFGVCVRAERVPSNGYDVHLPIHDFSVPQDDADVVLALKNTLHAALTGRTVYVGCMGGWGRTGLFMALLAKAAGIENPVEYVRSNYTPRAVETKGQLDFVEKFDVSRVRRWLFWHGWKSWFANLRG